MNSLGLAVFVLTVTAAHAGLIGGNWGLGAPFYGPAAISAPFYPFVGPSLVPIPYATPFAHAPPFAVAHAAPLAAAHAAPLAAAAPFAVSYRAAGLGLPPPGFGHWMPDIHGRLFDGGFYNPYVSGL